MITLPAQYLTERKTLEAIKKDIENFSSWAEDESDFFEILDKINILEEVITDDFSRKQDELISIERQTINRIQFLYKQSEWFNSDRPKFNFEEVKVCLERIELFIDLVLNSL